MLGWLWRVFVGRFLDCSHKWEQQGAYESKHDTYPHFKCMIICLRCSKCGDIRKRVV